MHTLALERADHFTPLAPINRLLADRVLDPREGPFELDLDDVAYADSWHARREARDLGLLAELRGRGVRWDGPYAFEFTLRGGNAESVQAAARHLTELGFSMGPVREPLDADGAASPRITAARTLVLGVDAVLAASRQVAEAAADARVVDEGWTAQRARR